MNAAARPRREPAALTPSDAAPPVDSAGLELVGVAELVRLWLTKPVLAALVTIVVMVDVGVLDVLVEVVAMDVVELLELLKTLDCTLATTGVDDVEMRVVVEGVVEVVEVVKVVEVTAGADEAAGELPATAPLT